MTSLCWPSRRGRRRCRRAPGRTSRSRTGRGRRGRLRASRRSPAGADVAVAAEEALGRRRRRTASGRGRGRCRWPAAATGVGVEGGVLAEDGLLERSRPGPGSTPSSSTRRRRTPAMVRQRLSLAAGTVLGEREQLPPALPQRRRLGEGLGLGENVAVVAGCDGCLEPPFLGVETELGEPVGFQAAGLPLLELGERAAAPQGERLGRARTRHGRVRRARGARGRASASASNWRASTASAGRVSR